MASSQRVDQPTRTAASLFDRQPPRNLDAEKGVLGSILLLQDACDEAVLVVKAEDFYDPANQKLFTHLKEMHESGGRIDTTLLLERLRKHNDLDAVGGMNYLAEVVHAVPTAANVRYYAEIVRDKATLRNLIQSSTEILGEAYDDSCEAREMLARAEQKVFAILDRQTSSGHMKDIQTILSDALHRIDQRMNKDHVLGGVETGFTDLDALMGGLHDGELIIIAARPSMGKTAFAMNIAEYAAVDRGVGTLFVSLEMSSLELADRLLCSRARVNSQRLRNGTISNDDRRKLVDRSNEISQAPLYVDDSPSRTMTEIAATARRLKRRNGLGLIVVDYLQLIEPDNQRDPRQEQVARIARRLKGMARELNVPVLCLAQLNRQADMTKESRPRLSHLRESGAIEQDADVVMFVHREDYGATTEAEKQELQGQAEIIVAKQRNGPIGEARVCWQKDFTRFTNAAAERYNEFDQYNSSGAEF